MPPAGWYVEEISRLLCANSMGCSNIAAFGLALRVYRDQQGITSVLVSAPVRLAGSAAFGSGFRVLLFRRVWSLRV